MLEARAFNRSILFMVASPYLTLAGLGFVVYRTVRAARKSGETASNSAATLQ